MNIQSITIQNFRNIGKERTFYLNKNFTAFIGVNGKGKSTILHALRVASGSYFLSIPNSEVKSRHIHKDEIRLIESEKQLLPQFPVNIEVSGTFPGINEPITWRRQWIEGSSSSTTKNADVGKIKEIAWAQYEKVTKVGNDKENLPLIAFFGNSRAFGSGRNTQKSRLHRLGRIIFRQGYQDWDEMRAVKFHYPEWLSSYDVLLKQEKEYPGTKEAFFEAVKKANPFITQIEFEGELWVKVKIDEDESSLLPLSLHSDGVHYFTEMVAEMAYRCIVLNGYRQNKAVNDATGIVMIDEIDLHLHPKWQRHVVSDLKKAFPNIQFVVTTHSPFIVQSLKSDEIWNLDKVMDVAPDELKIDTVATEIMGVSSSYSESNESLYIKSKQIMEDMDTEKPFIDIQKEMDHIPDPAVRAFLELQKISKGK
jgi:predicted ATP-binding protein involved in virulence